VLVKQNFVCGLAFGAAVLVASALTGELRRTRVVTALGCGAVGAAAVVAATVGWAAAAGVDLRELWFATYEFRTRATSLLSDQDRPGPSPRVATLTASFLFSGLAMVVVLLLAAAPAVVRDRAHRRYLAGVVALAAVATAGVLLGGSWWRHYLVQLIPTAALVTALLVPRTGWLSDAARAAGVLVGVSAGIGTVAGAVVESRPPEQVRVARHLAEAAGPGDTGVVTWGHAEVLFYAGLTSPYPHLWSLPIRTLDEDLSQLLDVMRGPDPPTWVVRWNPFSSWQLDDHRELVEVVSERYELVAEPCGRWVFLLRGEERHLPDEDPCG
jgi:hypothetical protein